MSNSTPTPTFTAHKVTNILRILLDAFARQAADDALLSVYRTLEAAAAIAGYNAEAHWLHSVEATFVLVPANGPCIEAQVYLEADPTQRILLDEDTGDTYQAARWNVSAIETPHYRWADAHDGA